MIASVRRTTTPLTTGLNPFLFGIVSNAPRDFTQAYVFKEVIKTPAEYVYQYIKAIGECKQQKRATIKSLKGYRWCLRFKYDF